MALMISGLLLFATGNAIASASSDIKINEVLYWPGIVQYSPGVTECAWVELYNTGTASENLNGWTISDRNATVVATLPNVDLPPGKFLRVLFCSGTNDFDFSDEEGSYYTGTSTLPFSTTEDEVGLYTGSPDSSTIVDFVSYSSDGSYDGGTAHDYAITAGIWTSGQFVNTSSLVKRESFGLIFNGFDHDSPEDWMIYDWTIYQTIGRLQQANPAQISPSFAKVIADATPTFVWKGHGRATKYQLQVDNEYVGGTLPSPIIDVTVSATQYTVSDANALANGLYFWRVRAYDGTKWSSWSKVWSFAVFLGGVPTGATALANIFHDYQHKDTKIVCLVDATNGNRHGCLYKFHKTLPAADPTGRHDWVTPHKVTSAAHVHECPLSNTYCSIAVISMINRYYQADHKKHLSQDYISYHMFKDIAPPGGPGRAWKPDEPEGDLGHGVGTWLDVAGKPNRREALAWTLGLTVAGDPEKGDTTKIDLDQTPTFADIKRLIDAGKPIFDGNWRHARLIFGYATVGGVNYTKIDDPTTGQAWYRYADVWITELMTPNVAVVNPKSDPPSVGGDYDVAGETGYGVADKKDDADDDHVCDFDETGIGGKRLHSVKNDNDSDHDCIDDYHEVWSYTFGRGLPTPSVRDPDVDKDNKRAENDPDTDAGGVIDGIEDENADGKVDPVETDPFNKADDNIVTYIESCDKDKKVCDVFEPDKKVYVKGIKLKADDAGDIYVVDNQMWTNGMDIKNVKPGAPDNYCLKKDVKAQGDDDFVGSPIELGKVSNDPGPCNIPYPGKYDIVYDVNQNKKYDSNVDLVDKVTCTGFETIPEFATIAIPVAAIFGLVFLFSRRKRKE